MEELPDYAHPPVTEIIAAVQFAPLARFGVREAVEIAKAFHDWELVDVPPALDPIAVDPPGPGAPPAVRLRFGTPPPRVVLGHEGGRWLVQVQQDRIAAHERKVGERPSFANVVPKVREVADNAGRALDEPLLAEPHAAELVEVIYENEIAAGAGWDEFSDMHRVLRALKADAGAKPFGRFEQARVSFTYELPVDSGRAGTLSVLAEPTMPSGGRKAIHLRLISRRIIHNEDLDSVLGRCHADIVLCFTAITTEQMHKIWGRFR